MKYRLKDQELQTKLDELSTEFKFSDRLQLAMRKFKRDGIYWDSCLIRVQFGKIVGFAYDDDKECIEELTREYEQGEDGGFDVFTAHAFYLDPDEDVEGIPYNPHAWNRWPDVTPPANVPMRVTKIRNGNIETFCCRTWVPENNFDLQWRKDFGGAWWVIHSGKLDEIDDDTWEPDYTFLFRPWDDEEDKE